MNCTEVSWRLSEYVDGELDPPSSVEVMRHLEQCRSCFSRAEFERRLREVIRRSCRSEGAPPDLRMRLRRLLRLLSS